MLDVDAIGFDAQGLCPVVIQEAGTGRVLMLGYTDRTGVERTLRDRQVHLFSRSRQEPWHKGDTSGQRLHLRHAELDCDADTLLYRVRAPRGACHLGQHSCFGPDPAPGLGGALGQLWQTLESRRDHPEPGSYTAALLEAGRDRILRKVGEEAGEVIIAGKNDEPEPLAQEVADLLYHVSVLLLERGLEPDDVARVLLGRAGGPRRAGGVTSHH